MKKSFAQKDAAQILQSIDGCYSTLRSYVDAGAVSTLRKGKQLGVVRFATAFSRPDRFRFEAQSQDARLGVADIRLEELKGPALASLVPATAGVVQRIPRLLVGGDADDSFGRAITEFRTVTRLDDELVDGVSCARLEGVRHQEDRKFGIWVGDDFLIRRVTVEDVSIEMFSDTKYSPRADTVINWRTKTFLDAAMEAKTK